MDHTPPMGEQILSICDTDGYSIRDGFAAFRESIANAFMPWTLERPTTDAFSARLETFATEAGAFGRTVMPPLVGVRDHSEISRSPEECLYANYVISGQLHIEQGGCVSSANSGELVVYDSTIPLRHIKLGNRPFEDLAFSIPKSSIGAEGRRFGNTLVGAHAIMAPLAGCFSYLMQPFASVPADELEAVASVCATLLPLAVGWTIGGKQNALIASTGKRYQIELLKFVEEHLCDPELDPRMAAEHLGISVRYVHKLFALQGKTFSNCVRLMRLNRIRRAMHQLPHNHPISTLAFRWGFTDLSTFIRAFKNEFGCTPSQYRSNC